MIAAAIEKVELHRRFALWTIFAFGTRPASVVAGFMASTGFISMWISNSATVMMMMPIATATMTALSMHSAQGTTPDEGQAADAGADRSGFNRALLLGITYSASIGGVATLIGSPPNTIAAGVLENTFQMQVSFARWMAVGTPLALVLLPLTWLYLVKIAHKMPASGLDDRAVFRRMLDEMGPMSAAETRVLAVFTVVSACWVSRGFFDIEALRHVNDSTIAIAGALALL
jgi:sodium-dependent dicarboxylate transporter 2/3/5